MAAIYNFDSKGIILFLMNNLDAEPMSDYVYDAVKPEELVQNFPECLLGNMPCAVAHVNKFFADGGHKGCSLEIVYTDRFRMSVAPEHAGRFTITLLS